jgi:hypothetical protein
MKRKTTKKLSINRTTVTNLSNSYVYALRGGGYESVQATCAFTVCVGQLCGVTAATKCGCNLTANATCGYQCETLAQTACQPCLATVDPYYCSAQCTQITCAPCIDPV